jgi:hypothetical protein
LLSSTSGVWGYSLVGLRSRCESTERLAVDDDARGGASASLMAATSYSDRGEMYGCVFRSRSQIHPINTNTSTSIQLLGSLASEVEVRVTSELEAEKRISARISTAEIDSRRQIHGHVPAGSVTSTTEPGRLNNLVDHILTRYLYCYTTSARFSSPDSLQSLSDPVEEYMVAVSCSSCR